VDADAAALAPARDTVLPGTAVALRRAAPWLLIAATAAAHATAFAGSFQWDDFRVVVADPRVQSLDAWWRSMPGIRPLLKLSYALNHASGLGLAGFHAVNVAIHAGAVLLVRSLLLHVGRRADPGSPPAEGPALAGALLFAVHPVQTEVVAYVSGRSASLAGLLALASILAWLEGRARGRPSLGLAASLLFLAASLGAKETALVLPGAIAILSALDRRRPAAGRAADALRAALPHAALVAAAVLAGLALPRYREMAAAATSLRGPVENALTHLSALAWLGGQVVRPHALAADPHLPTLSSLTPEAAIAAVAVLLAAAFGGGLALRSRRPWIAFALLWTVLWLPVSGWVLPRPEPANDRQLYVALVGPAALAGLWLAGPGKGRRARLALAAALVLALAGLAAARGLVYRDEVTFWSEATRAAPENPRARTNLGHALALACRDGEAERAFLGALAIDPGQYRAAVNLDLLRRGELRSSVEEEGCGAAGSGAGARSPGAE